jgi:hypothetical protein
MTAVTPELLSRFDIPGPRYTSFPTADRFVEAFGADDYILALKQRKTHSGSRALCPCPFMCMCRSVSRFAITAPATRS